MKKEIKKEEKNNNLILDVYEKPSTGKWIILAIQHVFAMFGATVLVPILVNDAAGAEVLSIPVALFAAGLGTILYLICTKGRSPMFLGGSFAYIAPVAAAFKMGGKEAAFTGIMIVGIIYVIIAYIIKFTGKKWIEKLLPPIIVGPMIMIIGLGLASAAVGQIGLTGVDADWKGLVVALVAFLSAALVALRGKGFLKIIPFLSGIIAGYVAAVILGMVNFDPINSAAIISAPKFYIPFLDYTPSFVAILTIIPIGIVTLAEHVGEQKVLSSILERDLIKDPGLEKTILGDGVATFVSAFLGNSDTTTYGENVSVIGMTKIASVWVIGLAAIFSMVLGFFTKFTTAIATIPTPVLGGISVLLFGFIATNGIKVLVQNKVDFSKVRNVIIASTMLVLGLGGAVLSITTTDLTVSMSGMSLAAIFGIILNLLLPEENEVEIDIKD